MSETASLRASIIVMVLASTPAADARTVADLGSEKCEELAAFSVPGTASGLRTSGEVVTRATLDGPPSPVLDVEEDEDGALRLGLEPRCVVEGEICSVSAGTPPIRFAVNLPLGWNGKPLHMQLDAASEHDS